MFKENSSQQSLVKMIDTLRNETAVQRILEPGWQQSSPVIQQGNYVYCQHL